MAYIIIKFWMLAATGWMLFASTVYLWRRSVERAKNFESARQTSSEPSRRDVPLAYELSFAKWLEDEMPSGLKIDYIAGDTPVFAEGRVDGFDFYFRARGNWWQFEVAHQDDLSFSQGPMWKIERRYGVERFAAGYMPKAEALGFILDSVGRFRMDRSDFIGPIKPDG